MHKRCFVIVTMRQPLGFINLVLPATWSRAVAVRLIDQKRMMPSAHRDEFLRAYAQISECSILESSSTPARAVRSLITIICTTIHIHILSLLYYLITIDGSLQGHNNYKFHDFKEYKLFLERGMQMTPLIDVCSSTKP